MNTQGPNPKPRSRAIRATPAQFTLLKAAYSISQTPSTKAIAELSQQTKLPEKWICNWFGRQRTKSRKNGEVIDLTATSSAISDSGTTSTNGLKTETIDEPAKDALGNLGGIPLVSEAFPSQSSLPKAHQKTVKAKTKSRRQPPTRPTKPKSVVKPEPREETLPNTGLSTSIPQSRVPLLLPSVASSGTQRQTQQSSIQCAVPPLTRSGMVSCPQFSSIYLQNSAKNTSLSPANGMYASTGYFSAPLRVDGQGNHQQEDSSIHNNNERPTLPESYAGFPASSPLSKVSEPGSPQVSPLASPAVGPNPDFSYAQVPGYFSRVFAPSSVPVQQSSLYGLQPLLDPHSQAYTAMYNKNPAAYRTMLMNYAALFPALLPVITGALVALGSSSDVSGTSTNTPRPIPNSDCDFEDALPNSSPDSGLFSLNSGLEVPGALLSPLVVKQEVKEMTWESNTNYLDFSSLHYDYAPLIHLRDRLQPFRLPESEYLFGKEAVVDHLLDERLGVEEPFQAAMGLVLLSKLGLKW